MRTTIRSPTNGWEKEKRQAQKTSPTKAEKGEAKVAVRQADKKRLVFLLGFVVEQKSNKIKANLRFWLRVLWNFSTAQ